MSRATLAQLLSGRRDHAPPHHRDAAVGRLSLLDGSQADLKDLRVKAPSSTLGSTSRRARSSRAVLLLLGVKTNVFGALELEYFLTAHLVDHSQSDRNGLGLGQNGPATADG